MLQHNIPIQMIFLCVCDTQKEKNRYILIKSLDFQTPNKSISQSNEVLGKTD